MEKFSIEKSIFFSFLKTKICSGSICEKYEMKQCFLEGNLKDKNKIRQFFATWLVLEVFYQQQKNPAHTINN